MEYIKTFENFISNISEDHVKGREGYYDFIYNNAADIGYPELENMELLISIDTIVLKAIYNMIEELQELNGSVEESSDLFLNENSSHEGWLVIGFDSKTKQAEILSIPLIKREAIRFLQNFEVQMSKMAKSMKKYNKLKIVHASEVLESLDLEGIIYNIK